MTSRIPDGSAWKPTGTESGAKNKRTIQLEKLIEEYKQRRGYLEELHGRPNS